VNVQERPTLVPDASTAEALEARAAIVRSATERVESVREWMAELDRGEVPLRDQEAVLIVGFLETVLDSQLKTMTAAIEITQLCRRLDRVD
jgi:hypothetical protein